jgi:hypothetical protein
LQFCPDILTGLPESYRIKLLTVKAKAIALHMKNTIRINIVIKEEINEDVKTFTEISV